MTLQEWKEEAEKCKKSPWYFMTKYYHIKKADGTIVPFTTMLSEEEFNELYKNNQFYGRRKLPLLRRKSID